MEYGRPGIIYSLYDGSVPVFRTSSKEWVVKQSGKLLSPDDVVFSDDPKQDNETRIFDKNFWLYDTINGIVSKIVQPKKIGDGMTGLYIPMLKDSMSFSIFVHCSTCGRPTICSTRITACRSALDTRAWKTSLLRWPRYLRPARSSPGRSSPAFRT